MAFISKESDMNTIIKITRKKLIIIAILLLYICIANNGNIVSSLAQEEICNGKIYCTATIEDDFDDNSIIITLFPEYSQYFGVKQEVANVIWSVSGPPQIAYIDRRT